MWVIVVNASPDEADNYAVGPFDTREQAVDAVETSIHSADRDYVVVLWVQPSVPQEQEA